MLSTIIYCIKKLFGRGVKVSEPRLASYMIWSTELTKEEVETLSKI